MKTILFVCTGNMCRSPMAEGLFEKMISEKGAEGIRVLSAGVSPPGNVPPAREAAKLMQDDGIDISSHRACLVGNDLVAGADLILVMGNGHKNKIVGLYPSVADKVFLLNEFAGINKRDITDPVGQSVAVYKKCAADIKKALGASFPKIIKFLKDKNENSNR